MELFDEMLQVRQLLRGQSTTQWTVISTGLFMSYLFLPDFGVVDMDKRIARALGSWENKVTVTTPEDIGRMVAEMVFRAEGTLNRVVHIGGETIHYRQLADVLAELFGGSFKRVEWTMDFLQQRLHQAPGNLWYKYQCIFGKGTGVSWDLDKTLNGQRGIAMTTVRDYITASYAT